MDKRTAPPRYTLSWAFIDKDKKPDQVECQQDFMHYFQNAGQDRGDRSFNRSMKMYSFIGEVWRLAEVAYFHVGPNADEYPEESVEWLVSRGWTDADSQLGYELTFTLRGADKPVKLGSPIPAAKLTYVVFDDQYWMIGPQWAINLSNVIHFRQAYGDFDYLFKH